VTDTIDVTPTPAEYARIARTLIENAYETGTADLTDCQVLWAFQSADQAARRIDAPLGEIPRRLGRELIRLYTGRARQVDDRPITADTTYADLATKEH